MEIFRMMFGIFFVIRMEDLWISYGFLWFLLHLIIVLDNILRPISINFDTGVLAPKKATNSL